MRINEIESLESAFFINLLVRFELVIRGDMSLAFSFMNGSSLMLTCFLDLPVSYFVYIFS